VCYSAQIRASYRRYVREWGADVSIKQFFRLYWLRSQGAKIKIPKAMDAAFSEPETDEERQIAEMIAAYNAEQATKLEQELFKQRKRLADAERTLQTKTTKAAQESKRIATDKGRMVFRQAQRPAPHGPQRRGPPHLPRLVCARSGHEAGSPDARSHALPVPPSGQASVL
jgi:hypothetical protein